MAVDDHGLEAIRKAAVEITPGDKSNYLIRTQVNGGNLDTVSGGKVTFFNITESSWTKFTNTSATRVAICFQNNSDYDVHIEHESNGTPIARGVTRGVRLASGSERTYAVGPSASIWFRAYTGAGTVELCAEELEL